MRNLRQVFHYKWFLGRLSNIHFHGYNAFGRMAFSRVLPSSFPLLLALVGGLFFVAVWYETQRLPEALTESDEVSQPKLANM